MATSTTTSTGIRWPQIASLVSLHVAILISWLAYHEFQPKLLVQFRFTEFALALAILQGVILAVTPPLAGLAADRMVRRGGNRLPVVTTGINFVSMVFMVVALTVYVDPGGIIRLLFPVMVALWLVAMNIFHSPAISSVEMFVPARQLPQVIALFAILADLVAALEPSLVDIINKIGGPITFAVGGILVFATGLWFTRSTKNLVTQNEALGIAPPQTPTKSNFAMVLGLGLLLGCATTFFFKMSPTWMETRIADFIPEGWTGNYMASLLIGLAALVSYPMGLLAGRIGAGRMAVIAGLAAAALAGGIYATTGAFAFSLFLLFPLAFAACTVTFLPLAFGQLARGHLILGIGVFFSGVEIAGSIYDILQVAG